MNSCELSPQAVAATAGTSHFFGLSSLLTALALTVAVAWGAGCGDQASVEPSANTDTPPATADDASQQSEEEPSPAKDTKPEPDATISTVDFDAVEGQWYRVDGGYVIVIEEAKRDGRLKADYFNPNPINVAKAEASEKGGQVQVFIELRDQNYPGCTYNLTYDAERDTLEGTYFQASMGQTYDVLFVRMRQ